MDKVGKSYSKSQRNKRGDKNIMMGDLKLAPNDLRKMQDLRTAEVDGTKSDLRASVNSSNLDLSS